jgi:hypothetical protein
VNINVAGIDAFKQSAIPLTGCQLTLDELAALKDYR